MTGNEPQGYRNPLAVVRTVRKLFVVVDGTDKQVGQPYLNEFLANRKAAEIGGHVESYNLV